MESMPSIQGQVHAAGSRGALLPLIHTGFCPGTSVGYRVFFVVCMLVVPTVVDLLITGLFLMRLHCKYTPLWRSKSLLVPEPPHLPFTRHPGSDTGIHPEPTARTKIRTRIHPTVRMQNPNERSSWR